MPAGRAAGEDDPGAGARPDGAEPPSALLPQPAASRPASANPEIAKTAVLVVGTAREPSGRPARPGATREEPGIL